jgi:hypothetical protein
MRSMPADVLSLTYARALCQVASVPLLKDIVSLRLMNGWPRPDKQSFVFLDMDYLPGPVALQDNKPDFHATGFLFTVEWGREEGNPYSRGSEMVNFGCFAAPPGQKPLQDLERSLSNHWLPSCASP